MLPLLIISGIVVAAINENLPNLFRCRIIVQSDVGEFVLYWAGRHMPRWSLVPGTWIVATAHLGGFYDIPFPVWVCTELHTVQPVERASSYEKPELAQKQGL